MKKFTIAILLGIAILFIIAHIDTAGVIILSYEKYTQGDFPIEFWHHFKNTAIILMIIPAISYYLLSKKDKSEALAVFLIPFIGFWFGITDLLYFWLQRRSIPSVLNHLNTHPIIGNISHILGFSSVTATSLYITTIVGIIITYITVKYLKEKV